MHVAFENLLPCEAINISIRPPWRQCANHVWRQCNSHCEVLYLNFHHPAGARNISEPQLVRIAHLEAGLDSLSFALIVARLEDAVGFGPFDSDEEMRFPVKFGDFVRLTKIIRSKHAPRRLSR
jgi:hypothetical protein